MRSLVVVLVALLAGLVPAQAQTPDPSTCAAIAVPGERLACYDRLFPPTLPVQELPPVVIESRQLIPARPNGKAPARMTVSCTAGTLDVSFSFAGQLLSETSDDTAISFQVQQTGNIVRSLPVSDDNTSVSFGNTRDAEAFLEMLEGGDTLIVRVTPVRQRSVQVQFELKSRESEIAALREACAS